MSQTGTLSRPANHQALRALWSAVAAYDASKINYWIAVRNAVGIAFPVALAVALHAPSSGVLAAIGALNVAAADDIDPYRNRARRMGTLSLFVFLAVFIGALVAENAAGAFLAAILGTFVAGLAVSLGAAIADIAVMTLVVLFIFSAQTMTPANAALAATTALAGGLFQTLLSVALWPIRGLQPDRSIIGDLFSELSGAAIAPPNFTAPPLASHQSNYVREALSANPNARHSLEARRLLLLVNQAERLRLSLLALRSARGHLEGDPQCHLIITSVDPFLAVTAQALAAAAQALRDKPTAALPPLDQWITRVRQSAANVAQGATNPRAVELLYRTNSLAEQLSDALQTIGGAAQDSEQELAAAAAIEQQLHTPWRHQMNSWLVTMRANLSLDSSACRHAIRLTLCVALADLISRYLGLERSYWVAMTVALVLKPDFGSTFSRGALRLGGTYFGLLLATALIIVLAPTGFVYVALIALFSIVFRAWGRANYGILSVAITAMVVFLFSLSGIDAGQVISTRAINTSIGGALALAIYWIWPTREATQAPPALASMLDGYRLYLQAVAQLYTNRGTAQRHELERVRLNGRRLRSNAETAVERFAAEPNADPANIGHARAIITSSHRFVYAAIDLEAGDPPVLSGPARDAFEIFTWDLEKTLYFLAAHFRGSPVHRADLPDLAHSRRRLLLTEDCAQPACALLVLQTGDLVNSLNLLSDAIFAWTPPA